MWIRVIEPEKAQGELKAFYDELVLRRGKVSNIMKCQSLNLKAMKSHLDLYLSVMFQRSGLSRAEREAIAVVVSCANQCDYCLHHHAAALRFYWKDDRKVQQLMNDYRQLELDTRLKTMLDFAWKLTLHPQQIMEDDLTPLRKVGLKDEDILDLVLVVGYFNFVNRLALALGVDFDAKEIEGYKY